MLSSPIHLSKVLILTHLQFSLVVVSKVFITGLIAVESLYDNSFVPPAHEYFIVSKIPVLRRCLLRSGPPYTLGMFLCALSSSSGRHLYSIVLFPSFSVTMSNFTASEKPFDCFQFIARMG